MKYFGKAQAVAEQIIEAFEAGRVPKALALVLIHREMDCPAAGWSWRNRFLVALRGDYDARGYRQWQSVGRQVKKGETATHILVPRLVNRSLSEEEEKAGADSVKKLIGFGSAPVFGASQTEG